MFRDLSPLEFSRAVVYTVAYTYARREILRDDAIQPEPTIAAYWDDRDYNPSPGERKLAEAAIRDALAGRPAALP